MSRRSVEKGPLASSYCVPRRDSCLGSANLETVFVDSDDSETKVGEGANTVSMISGRVRVFYHDCHLGTQRGAFALHRLL